MSTIPDLDLAKFFIAYAERKLGAYIGKSYTFILLGLSLLFSNLFVLM